MGEEHKIIAERLRRYRADMGVIMNLIGSKQFLPPDEKREAQQLLRVLKEHLRADVKRGSAIRDQTRITQAEDQWLYPALREAVTEIRSAWNSNPITSEWHAQLYAARIDIDFLLDQLESSFPQT